MMQTKHLRHPLVPLLIPTLLAQLLFLSGCGNLELEDVRTAPESPTEIQPQAVLPATFWEGLQPGIDGLETVYEALEQEKFAEAETAYLDYLRTKSWNPSVLQPLDPLPVSDERTASGDEAVAGQVRLLGHTQDYGGTVNWMENPTTFGDWLLLLNRHRHWLDLTQAFQATGNPAYLQAFADQFASWRTAAPMPDEATLSEGRAFTRHRGHRRPFAPAWRTIEVGERLRDVWPKVFATILRQPELPDAVLLNFVAAIHQQADFLVEFEGPNNWMYIEGEGLLRASALFPEFARAGTWSGTALGRIERSLQEEVYPDGAHEELTFWYQETVRRSTTGIARMARTLDQPLSDSSEEALRRMHEAVLRAVQPDGRLPQVNDGDTLSAGYILAEAARRYEDPRFIFGETRGRNGEHPGFDSVDFPYAGWAVMRSDWTPTANYAFFQAGPFGGHAHEDKLGLILFGYGEAFLIDTGRAAYSNNAWRNFNIGPRAHSTVLFDGKGQTRRWWQDNRLMHTEGPAEGFFFATDEAVDYTRGSFGVMPDEVFYDATRGFAFVAQTRHVFFLKPDRWVIVDVFDEREVHPETPWERYGGNPTAPEVRSSLFQFADLPIALDADTPSLLMGKEDGARLRMSWSANADTRAELLRGQEEPDLLGWRFLNMGESNRPVPIPTLRINRPVNRLPAVDVYLLQATPAGEAPAAPLAIRLEDTQEAAWTIHLQSGETFVLPRTPAEDAEIEVRSQENVWHFPYKR